MVIVTLSGGLGNQLFQYAVGKQLALKNGTGLKLYTTNITREPGRTYKLCHFNIDAELATEEEVNALIGHYYNDSLYSKIYRKLDGYRPRYRRKYFIETAYYCFEPELMSISSDVLLEGFWQHKNYFENFPAAVKEGIVLQPGAIQPSQFVGAIENDDQSVSLHIRRGDYISDPGNLSFFGVLPLEYYYKAVEYIQAAVPGANFYIFSDDLTWAKEQFKPNAALIFVEIGGGEKDYLEMHLMSRCRHNIIANSSFSWWAAFLNKNPGKIIIAPRTWVVDKEQNAGVQIQLTSWIRM
jgi:hypothetical protein